MFCFYFVFFTSIKVNMNTFLFLPFTPTFSFLVQYHHLPSLYSRWFSSQSLIFSSLANYKQCSSSWSSFRRVTKFLQHNQPFPWGTGGNLTVPGEVRSNIIIFIITMIAVTIISTSTIAAIIINPQRWNSLTSKTALLDSGHHLPSNQHPHHQHDHHIDIICKHHLHRRHSS